MNEDDKLLIISLAKARTEAVYKQRLEAVAKRNEEWAEMLNKVKEEFATVSFLKRGYMRYGKVTSNGVEVINSAIEAARCLPIAYLIDAIVKYQREKYNERKKQGIKWSNEGKDLTDYAASNNLMTGEGASSSFVGKVEVWVNTDTFETGCPCLNAEEMGAPCFHLKALLLRLGKNEKEWFHGRYHTTTYSESYNAVIPAMTTVGKLDADETFIPADHKASAGRPTKKRKAKDDLRKTSIKRTCKACGKKGHFAMGCQHPSTRYRVQENISKAIKWCREQEGKATEAFEWEVCPEEDDEAGRDEALVGESDD